MTTFHKPGKVIKEKILAGTNGRLFEQITCSWNRKLTLNPNSWFILYIHVIHVNNFLYIQRFNNRAEDWKIKNDEFKCKLN